MVLIGRNEERGKKAADHILKSMSVVRCGEIAEIASSENRFPVLPQWNAHRKTDRDATPSAKPSCTSGAAAPGRQHPEPAANPSSPSTTASRSPCCTCGSPHANAPSPHCSPSPTKPHKTIQQVRPLLDPVGHTVHPTGTTLAGSTAVSQYTTGTTEAEQIACY